MLELQGIAARYGTREVVTGIDLAVLAIERVRGTGPSPF